MLDLVTGRETIQAPPQRVTDGGAHSVIAFSKLAVGTHQWTEAGAEDMQIGGIAWSKDGRRILAAGSAGKLYLWNRSDRLTTPLTTAPVLPGLIGSAVLSPDESLAIVTDASIKRGSHATSHIALVRLRDGAVLKQIELAVRTYLCSAWAPDGKTFVVGCSDNAVHVFEAASMKETAVLKMHTDEVQCLSYSKDGKYLLSGAADNSICLWDLTTGTPKQRFLGHHDNVNSAEFSPDGKRVVSASDDGTVRVWEPENGQELLTLSGHTRAVRSAQFTPDGTRIVSAGWDKTVRVWYARPGDDADSGVPPGRAK
jgi:WD40 repeat protein